MTMNRAALVVFVVLALALYASAKGAVTKSKERALEQSRTNTKKFDWNHETVWQMLPVIKPFGGSQIRAPRATWRGKTSGMTEFFTVVPGGHNFATRRAVDYAIAKAKDHPAHLLEVMKVPNIGELSKDKDDQVFAMYCLLYGNFQNELRVNLDGDLASGAKYAAAALTIGGRFKLDREITPGAYGPQPRSYFWHADTGYSSANPIHSMLASSSDATKNRNIWTQAKSLQTLTKFATDSLTESITLLRQEKARVEQERAEALAEQERAKTRGLMGKIGKGVTNVVSGTINTVGTLGSMAMGRGGYAAGWSKALRLIGSVLHTVQDSACACTPKHWEIESTKDCLAGDGHGIIGYFPDEKRWKVTGLSDGVFYKERLHYHEALDLLYEEGRVLDVDTLASKTNEQIDALTGATNLYGSFDPAIAGGNIILSVVEAVYDTTDTPAVAAGKIVAAQVASRYASNLRMPTIQESTCEKQRYQLKSNKIRALSTECAAPPQRDQLLAQIRNRH